MSYVTIGTSFLDNFAAAESNDDNAKYYEIRKAGNKIWLFTRQFREMPSCNYGDYVTYGGGHARAFNCDSNTWEYGVELPGVADDDLGELLFVVNGCIHLLLFPRFGAIRLHSLYKWTGSGFELVEISSDVNFTSEEEMEKATIVLADREGDGGELLLVSTLSRRIRIIRLSIDGDRASATHHMDVPEEENRMYGTCVSAALLPDNRLVLSLSVRGCGVRWTPERVIICDVEGKTAREVMIESGPLPRFHFPAGARLHGVHDGKWIHCTGYRSKQLSPSEDDDKAFELNVDGEPSWSLLPFSLPSLFGDDDFAGCISDGTLYALCKQEIGTVQL